MTTSPPETETGILQAGASRLGEMLGEGWEVAPVRTAVHVGGNTVAGPNIYADMVWAVRHTSWGGGQGQVLVEAVRDLSPAKAETILMDRAQLMRQLMGQVAVLVLAPWLSPRTRTVLERRGFGYLDLTGNVSFHLALPPVHIVTAGAQRNPVSSPNTHRGLSGAKAGRLVRVLVDFEPPYTARELARVAKISEGYISRLLDAMTNEALITRTGRHIVDVDWVGLLEARSRSYKLLRANLVVPTVARRGRAHALDALSQPSMNGRALLTGSVAAQAVAPVAVGGQLMIYVPLGPREIDNVAAHLGLLRSTEPVEGNDGVLLLQAPTDGPLDRPAAMEGAPAVQRVGLSQLVLDCLGGPGRMPAEGEALLQHMRDTVGAWREPHLPDPAPASIT